MDIQRLSEETRQVTVEFAGETASVAFRPNVFTLGLSAEFVALQETNDVPALAGLLERLIAGWDLTFDGEPIPVTAEGIARVPLPLLNAIQDAVASDLRPSDAEGKASSGPTSMPSGASTAPAQTFPSGSPTSPLPSGSASPSPSLSEPVSTG